MNATRASYTRSCVSVLAVAFGCQGGVSRTELPAAPIAFVYYDEELAQRRADLLNQRTEARRVTSRGEDAAGVLDLNRFGQYLEGTFGAGDFDAKYSGRLALLHPRDGAFEILSAATRGAAPKAWSNDHERLLFAQETGAGVQLFELHRETGEVARMTRGPAQHPWGCYGPDGRLIASEVRELTDARGASQLESRIGLMEPSGDFELISAGPYDHEPTCAPDGSAFAYVLTDERGRDAIWVREPSADALPRLIAPGKYPSFAPDSEWIFYTQDAGDRPTLWRVRVDGAGRTRLGSGSGAEELRPSVSPDGGYVVYESVLENRFRLFLRRTDGTGDRVLFAQGDGTNAVW